MSGRHREKGVNVQVVARCRPFSGDESSINAPQVVTFNEFQRQVVVSQNLAGKQIDKVYTFDGVFGPAACQGHLYDQAVFPIVNEVLEGFNCTIIAYGQAGTYTMKGECKRLKSGLNGELPPEAGVIPRAVQQIFDALEGQNAEYGVSFLELYNEEITDLLAPEELSRIPVEDKQKKHLPLMEDGKGGVLVRGLEEKLVTSASEIFTLLERGSAKRRPVETLLNKQSSQSHSLFSITIHIKEATPEGKELIKCGKLDLYDLAGSENISRSGAREGRAREAGEINKSLVTLGRVINTLEGHPGHTPYRDSKLTRLLRDSLGGKTKTCIIATVSPAVHCLEETSSILDYAYRAKNVNQKVTKSTLITDLYGEIDRLKAEVHAAREKNGVYVPKERYCQEESERKQFKDLRAKFDAEVLNSSNLSIKLNATEESLDQTLKLLANNSKEEEIRCQLISEQKKADREDKLNADNRSVMDNYQAELPLELRTFCKTVAASISQQNEHLRCIEKLCDSFSDVNVKFLGAESVEANLIFDELHKSLSIQPGELANFASDLRQKFTASFDLSTNILKYIHGFLDKLIKEAKQLESHASDIGEVQTKSITDFQKVYEMEPSLSSLAFSGSVEEGVDKVIKENKLLVIYVSGNNLESKNLERCTWTDFRLAEVLSKDCILLHVREGSVDAAYLSKSYPQNPPPCTTLIGVEGKKLWQSGVGGFFTAEVLASIIENADQDVLLNIRLPDCNHLQGKFSLISNLREVKNYVDGKQRINMASHDLALPSPGKVFGNEDLNKSLLELKIVDKQTLIVVPHEKSLNRLNPFGRTNPP